MSNSDCFFVSPHIRYMKLQGSKGGGRKYYHGAVEPEVLAAREEQRKEFDSILDDVNKFVYANMTSTRKERALKKQWENTRAEALGCTPEKGVNHGFKHLKQMREAKALKRVATIERAQAGEDVDTRTNLNRDVTEVRKMRMLKRKEKRQRRDVRGVDGSGIDSKATIGRLAKKFNAKLDSRTNIKSDNPRSSRS